MSVYMRETLVVLHMKIAVLIICVNIQCISFII